MESPRKAGGDPYVQEGQGVYRDSEGKRCSHPRRGRNDMWGRQVHTGAREALTLGEEAGREGGGPGDPRGPGPEAWAPDQCQHGPRRPPAAPSPPRPAALGSPGRQSCGGPAPRHLGGEHAGVPESLTWRAVGPSAADAGTCRSATEGTGSERQRQEPADEPEVRLKPETRWRRDRGFPGLSASSHAG